MDLDMYAHPSTKENLEKAERFGHHIIPAEFGELASGFRRSRKISRARNYFTKNRRFFYSTFASVSFLDGKPFSSQQDLPMKQ